MKITATFVLATASLSLVACGDDPADPDTAYEQQLPEPVQEGGEGMASVPDNESIEGGPDEQVDAEYAGDAQLPENEPAN